MTALGAEAVRRRLHLQPGVAAAIRRHGTETYPDECCGALIGRDGLVHGSPDDYRASERRATESGAELLGFYHSHPDHPARPSQYDLDHAWPSFSYIIVAVRGGVPEEMTSWRLKDDRSAFDQENLMDGPN
jgi:proteasome lid subunit RPN8/RPN11